jgi:hypothetical protein
MPTNKKQKLALVFEFISESYKVSPIYMLVTDNNFTRIPSLIRAHPQ